MRILISGGHELEQNLVCERIANIIDGDKPMLYISFSIDEKQTSYEIIQNKFKNFVVPFIDIINTIEDLENKNYSDYSAVYIDGDNPFKLLNNLKESGNFDKLKQYIINDGIVIGSKAGAKILGQFVDYSEFIGENDIGLEDATGLNLLNCFSLFINESKELIFKNKDRLLELSKNHSILALSEDSTLYIENGIYEIICNKPFCIFNNGNMIVYNSNYSNIEEYYMLKNDSQLMDFMNSNITYGWIDTLNNLHLNNLVSFRKNYVISSVDQILKTKVGTCIEQAKLEKYFFDSIGLESKLYCHRSYESEDNINDEIKMHCFLLFKYNDKWYHFEHADSSKRGIHPYTNLREALNNICSGFEKNDIRILTEIPDIPEKLSFNEFNEYVNNFDLKNKTI